MVLMVLVVILGCAVYATLLVRYLAERSQAADAGPPIQPETPAPPCCAANDLADPGRSAWTALDDHQLTRLLKESSS
jgi:hypothetical protein